MRLELLDVIIYITFANYSPPLKLSGPYSSLELIEKSELIKNVYTSF
jgi:hypothetical protein